MDTITISRETFNDPIFRPPERLRIWLALLFAADENGEVVFGLRRFSQSIGVSTRQLRSAIKAFCENGYATHEATHEATHITLCDIVRCAEVRHTKRHTKRHAPISEPTLPSIVVSRSFVAPEFTEAWDLWLDYRKETKRPYKSEKSERIGYEQLIKKSNNDPRQALEIVKNTIANGYQGLFALKDEPKSKRNNPAVRSTDDRYTALERAAASILCGNDTGAYPGND